MSRPGFGVKKHIKELQTVQNYSPDKPFKDVLNDEIALGDDDEQSDVCPSEQGELLHVVLVDQRENEPHEPDHIQTERDEPMVGDQHPQIVLKYTDMVLYIANFSIVTEIKKIKSIEKLARHRESSAVARVGLAWTTECNVGDDDTHIICDKDKTQKTIIGYSK